MQETQKQLLASDQPSSGLCSHLGREPVDGRPLSLSASASLSFPFGYNTGVVSAPEMIIRSFLHCMVGEKLEEPPRRLLLTNLWTLSVAIFSGRGRIGSFSVGIFFSRFGRHNSVLIVNLLAEISGYLMGFCKIPESVETRIPGRLIFGIFCRLCTGFVPMYPGEISPTALRGAFGTPNQLGIVVGILMAQLFGLEVILGSEALWPVLWGFTNIPAILQSAALLFCPGSPRFLLISRKEDQAKQILHRLWGTQDVAQDIQEVKDESARMVQEQQVTALELWRAPSYRQPIIISIVLQGLLMLPSLSFPCFWWERQEGELYI
uniref:Major facilitator superfamily (MFS) profile domain-containing protein n=1 Tax=Oryctolagus cuniculus TaxID=9986 RepID=G1THE7_RABIT